MPKLTDLVDWEEGDTKPASTKPKPNAFIGTVRGRPRRAFNKALRVSVRIDPVAKTSLTREFGSLGNALFFLFEGIQQQRKLAGVQTEELSTDRMTLKSKELELLLTALKYFIEQGLKDHTLESGKDAKPYRAVGKKIVQFLFKD